MLFWDFSTLRDSAPHLLHPPTLTHIDESVRVRRENARPSWSARRGESGRERKKLIATEERAFGFCPERAAQAALRNRVIGGSGHRIVGPSPKTLLTYAPLSHTRGVPKS